MSQQIDIISKYFTLNDQQLDQFDLLVKEIVDWNAKINLISRKDMENVATHHILHSLAIAKYTTLNKSGTRILDLGTGGGFPGLPLAIMWPKAKFHLVDSRGKKIMVVKDLIEKLALDNCTAQHIRAEELPKKQYHFVVSRAVAQLPQLMEWCNKLFSGEQLNAVPNGLLCLKGGNVNNEIRSMGKKFYGEAEAINKYFQEAFFEEKFVVYVQSN